LKSRTAPDTFQGRGVVAGALHAQRTGRVIQRQAGLDYADA
jgi:hypothetical protein